MLSDYEKNTVEGIARSPDPINISKEMTEAEKKQEIIRYIKQAIRNQPICFGRDIEKCNAFLDSIK